MFGGEWDMPSSFYREIVNDHNLRPAHKHELPNANRELRGVNPSCGDDITLYLYVEDGERLQRALNRERAQKEPRYAELCRRFLADEADFSEERLMEAGIGKRFENQGLEELTAELADWIRDQM